MRLSKFSKKWIAYFCAIAMVISSFAFTPSTDVNAAQSETIDGITYTVTDGAQGDWTGIVTQGIFDKARIHWAWGKAVDASSISITVNGVEVAAMGTNANGVHTTIAEVKDAVDSQMGEYTIKLTAVSTNEEQLEWTASLKMEEAAPTTTGEPGVITWVDVPASDGLQYDDSTNAKVINVQSPPWSEGKTGVYVEPPSGAGAPTAVKIDGTAYTANQGDNGAFFIQGAGILYYLDTFANETTTIEVSYAPNVESTLVIKNTKVSPTEETSVEPTTEEPTTEEPTTEEPTTEEPTTEEPTTEAPTVAPKPQDYYDDWVATDRNLAPLGTASDKGTHREGSVAAINDTVINSWNNWDAISIEGAITHGSFDIELDKAYDAASIDQVVVYWRTADVQFVPQAGYTVQFGYKGTFTTVATVSKSDYPTEGTTGGWVDEARFVTDSDFTSSRLPSSGVDTVRILVDTPVEWGAQVREVCVFSENPQDAPALPQADQPASVQGNSPDYNTIAFSVTPGEDQDNYKYNVYAGDTLIGEGVEGNQEYVAYGFNPGDYTLSAVSVVEGMDPSDPVYSDTITVADPLDLFASDKNKAVGGAVTAVSSFYNENYTLDTSQCAVDGSPAAGEGAAVCIRTGANQTATIDIDLQKDYDAKDLESFVLAYTNPRTYAANTQIGISADGEDYVEVANSTGFVPTKDGQLTANLIPNTSNAAGTFRYVRINLSGGTNAWGYCVNQIGVIVDDSEEPTTEEPSTEEPTTEAPTVEPSTEAPTGSGYNMHRLDYDTWTSLGGVFYAFTGSGNGAQVDVGYDAGLNKAKTTQISGGQWWTWNTQVAAVYPQYTDDVKAGKEYKIKWHIATEDGASGNVVITTETGEANPVDFSSGDLTLEGKLVYNDDLKEAAWCIGTMWIPEGVSVIFDNPEITGEEPTTEAPSVEPSTEAPSESPTVEPSTEAPTYVPGVMQPVDPEHFVVTEEIVEEGQVTGRWFAVGGYEIYLGYWNNASGQVNVDPTDGDHIAFQQLSSNWWGEGWGSQVRKSLTGLAPGVEYTLTLNLNGSTADGVYCTSSDGTLVPIKAGDQTVTITGTADQDGNVSFVVGTGNIGLAVVMDFSDVVVKDDMGYQVYPKVEPSTEAPSESPSVEPSTEAPSESTTVEPTTVEPTTQAPTQEPTTQAPTQKPTKAPTTTVAPTKLPDPVPVIRIPDKAKVKKAIKKKKSAKKIKVKIKKVAGAKGYQVQVSKKKKGKALVKKYTTKTKLTIKSKKFKKKKKLWVKVRAYTLDGTVKVFGAWSKPKKTKKK